MSIILCSTPLTDPPDKELIFSPVVILRALNILVITLIFLELFLTLISISSLPKNFAGETLLVVSLGVPPSLDILLRKFSYAGFISSIRVLLILF